MDKANQRYKELGDFLKTRRAKILPSQVGLPESPRRRAPGLRREELAYLSGIGVTWYTWLEQGRHIKVSAQVLENLSRVLLLDRQETLHLYTLAQQTPPTYFPDRDQTVNPMLQHVLDSLEFSPAVIVDMRSNVIAWNNAMAKILLDFSKMTPSRRNMLWNFFTDEQYKKMFDNWALIARSAIAQFRSTCGKYIDDPWIMEFVNDLRRESREFDLWWSLHEVKSEPETINVYSHPTLGQLSFEHTKFNISGNANLMMVIHTPTSETDTKQKIIRYLGL
ncbi:MAG: helix-turn-helix transcriptional regulator [Deltaproteobacteria bacterium]|nr:helix-turn-helix transcriptional regulator [Deltaproteobacteria bacterium]